MSQSKTQSRSVAELDRKISLGLYRDVGSKFPRVLFQLLEHSGNGVLWLVATPLIWTVPGLSSTTRCIAANFFLGLFVDLIIVGALKFSFRRPRPSYNFAEDFTLVVAVDKFSFPSGHTARAAYIAAFAIITSSQQALPVVFLVSSWAFAVSLSRALMGRHYFGDVVAGLFIGLMTTAVVTKGTFSPMHGWLSEQQSEVLYSRLAQVRVLAQ